MEPLGASADLGLSAVYRSVVVQRQHSTAPAFTINSFTRVQLSPDMRDDLSVNKDETNFDIVAVGRKGTKAWAAVIVIRLGSCYAPGIHTLRVELAEIVSATSSTGLSEADQALLHSPLNIKKPKMLAELSSSSGFVEAAANGPSSSDRTLRRKSAAVADRSSPEPMATKRKATPSKSVNPRKQPRTTATSVTHHSENIDPEDDSDEREEEVAQPRKSASRSARASRSQSGRTPMEDITNLPEFKTALESEVAKRVASLHGSVGPFLVRFSRCSLLCLPGIQVLSLTSCNSEHCPQIWIALDHPLCLSRHQTSTALVPIEWVSVPDDAGLFQQSPGLCFLFLIVIVSASALIQRLRTSGCAVDGSTNSNGNSVPDANAFGAPATTDPAAASHSLRKLAGQRLQHAACLILLQSAWIP